jgi:uncharacterized protein RhaS with RHS repeats
LEQYDFVARYYNPQIGRFLQIDPLADISEVSSPYSYASNNPISSNDPSGLKEEDKKGKDYKQKPGADLMLLWVML